MTVSSDTLALLMSAGLSGEQLLDVVRSIENDNPAQAQRQVSASAVRMRRLRERRAAEAGDVTCDVTCDANSDAESDAAPSSDKRNPQTPKKINSTPHEGDAPACEADPISPIGAERLDVAQLAIALILHGLVDLRRRRWKDMPPPPGVTAEQWQGFIDHRKAKRQTLTPRAYLLLTRKLEKHTDPEWPPGRVIDTIIERHWTSFERGWLDRITQQEHGNGQRAYHNGGNAGGRRFRDPLNQSDYDAGRIDPPMG